MLTTTHLSGFGAGGSQGPPVVAYQTQTVNTGNNSSYSFATQAIGTPDEKRDVVVAVFGEAAGNFDVSSVTIGGITAVLARAAGAANYPVELWIARVPLGTTATIAVVFTGTSDYCGIGVWSITGLDSNTPVDTAASGVGAILIDVPQQGVVIAAAGLLNSTTATWTNATERFDANSESTFRQTGADYQATAAEINRSISCVSTDANELSVAASWR
jgi:hypothetical protein